MAAAPLVSVAVAAVAFRERLTLVKVVGSAVAVGGIAVVSSARSELSLSSSVWILIGATIVQGVYHPMIKPLLRRYSGVEVAVYGMVSGTLMLLPLLPGSWAHIASASAGAWWSVIFLGVFPSALGFVLWGYTVGRLPMITSTSLLHLVPAFAVLIAFIWLGEVPVAGELLGGAVALVGVVTVGLGDAIGRRPARPNARTSPARQGRHTRLTRGRAPQRSCRTWAGPIAPSSLGRDRSISHLPAAARLLYMRHAYALLRPGERTESAVAELRYYHLRWDFLHVDQREASTPRPGLAVALDRVGQGGHLVIAVLSRLAADEGELIALTAELVDRDVVLDVGEAVLPAAADDGRPLFDRYLTGGPPQPQQPGPSATAPTDPARRPAHPEETVRRPHETNSRGVYRT